MQQKIEHPSHPGHWLSYCAQYRKGFKCNSCKEYMHGGGYRCDPCDFDLHVDCAMAPLQLIKHQSHPGHWLSYRAQYPPKGFKCDGCGGDLHRDGYTCRFCNFDLHVDCAMGPQGKITHQSHPGHWLSYCAQYPKGYKCDGCGGNVHRNGYKCSACNFDLHVDCAMGPQQKIKHQCHPGHWLSYRAQYPKGYTCDGCGEDGLIADYSKGYRCSACDFDLHVECATGPRVLCHPLHSGNGHRFELLTEPPGGVVKRCSVCLKSVSRLGYHCTSRLCCYSLHPTCALLPGRFGEAANFLALEEVLSSTCHGCGQTRGPGWGFVKASGSVAFHIACLPRILNLMNSHTEGGASTRHLEFDGRRDRGIPSLPTPPSSTWLTPQSNSLYLQSNNLYLQITCVRRIASVCTSSSFALPAQQSGGGSQIQGMHAPSSIAPPKKEKDRAHKLEKALKVSELVLDVANLLLTREPRRG